MSFEDDLRDTLESAGRAAEAPPGDLQTVMKRGRRRRIASYAGSGAAVVLVVGALSFGIQTLGNGADPIATADQALTSTTVADAAVTESMSGGAQLDREDDGAAPSDTFPASATTVTTAPGAGILGNITARFTYGFDSGAFGGDDFYAGGRARRVLIGAPLAVVDLVDGVVLDVEDSPLDAPVTYGIVEPDGDLLVQSRPPEACCELWHRDAATSTWRQLDGLTGSPELFSGYFGRSDGTVDLYFQLSPLGDESFEDGLTATYRYDTDTGEFVELWTAEESGSRYSTDPSGRSLLVEDQGVDPVYGPTYYLLDAATGERLDGTLPAAVFRDSEQTDPLATPDFASFVSEDSYAYFETEWDPDTGPGPAAWVIGSLTGEEPSGRAGLLGYSSSIVGSSLADPALFGCRYGDRTIADGQLVDLVTGQSSVLFPDYDGVIDPSC